MFWLWPFRSFPPAAGGCVVSMVVLGVFISGSRSSSISRSQSCIICEETAVSLYAVRADNQPAGFNHPKHTGFLRRCLLLARSVVSGSGMTRFNPLGLKNK